MIICSFSASLSDDHHLATSFSEAPLGGSFRSFFGTRVPVVAPFA